MSVIDFRRILNFTSAIRSFQKSLIEALRKFNTRVIPIYLLNDAFENLSGIMPS
jgi:hypothetical protein